MSDVNTVSAIPFIRQQAYRFADILAKNEDFVNDIEDNIAAIEQGKKSALTILWDIEQVFDAETIAAFPKVGSETPQGYKNNTNQLYDWYKLPDGKEASFYNDLADRVKPVITAMAEACSQLNRAKSDIKEDLRKAMPSIVPKELEKAFSELQFGTFDVENAAKLWTRRRNSVREQVRKAFQAKQIVSRLNTDKLSCRILTKTEKDGAVIGYSDAPNPVHLSNQPEIAANPGAKYQQVVWSINNLLALERPEKNEKGEDLHFTKLDNALAKGGTFDLITAILKREREDKGGSEQAKAIAALKAERPEQVASVANTLVGYFYSTTEGVDWKINDKAEEKLLASLSPENQQEAVITICKLAEAFDSLASKLSGRYSRIVQAAHDKADNNTVAA